MISASFFFSIFILFSEPGFEVDLVNSSKNLTLPDLWSQLIDGYKGPMLHSGLRKIPEWQSYGRWICRPKYSVLFETSLLNYWKWTENPGLIFILDDHIIRFEPGAELASDTKLTAEQWKNILYGDGDVCIYAAFLQYISEHEQLWILSRVKSDRGEWRQERDLISWR